MSDMSTISGIYFVRVSFFGHMTMHIHKWLCVDVILEIEINNLSCPLLVSLYDCVIIGTNCITYVVRVGFCGHMTMRFGVGTSTTA